MDARTPTQRMFDELIAKVMLYLREADCFGEPDEDGDLDEEVLEYYEREVRAAIGTVIHPSANVVAIYTSADIEHVMDGIFSPAWREDLSSLWRMDLLNEIVHSSEMRQAFEQIAGDIIYRKLGIT